MTETVRRKCASNKRSIPAEKRSLCTHCETHSPPHDRDGVASPGSQRNVGASPRLRLAGCSSHSGRRTFITNAAKKISTVGGSLRDVQALAGHSSLSVTQRYIEAEGEAQRKIVDLM